MTQGMIQFINTTSYLSAMVAVAFKYFPFTNFTFEPVVFSLNLVLLNGENPEIAEG